LPNNPHGSSNNPSGSNYQQFSTYQPDSFNYGSNNYPSDFKNYQSSSYNNNPSSTNYQSNSLNYQHGSNNYPSGSANFPYASPNFLSSPTQGHLTPESIPASLPDFPSNHFSPNTADLNWPSSVASDVSKPHQLTSSDLSVPPADPFSKFKPELTGNSYVYKGTLIVDDFTDTYASYRKTTKTTTTVSTTTTTASTTPQTTTTESTTTTTTTTTTSTIASTFALHKLTFPGYTVTTQAENPAGLSVRLPTFVENSHLGNVLLNPNRIVVADRLLHIAG